MVTEKLKHRTIRLSQPGRDAAMAKSAAHLLSDVKGVMHVRVVAADRLAVSYNVRQINLQIIEALLKEFGYKLNTGFFCRCMRSISYYLEDIECGEGMHDQSECTRDAFIARYLRRPHGCRDHRPEYSRHCL